MRRVVTPFHCPPRNRKMWKSITQNREDQAFYIKIDENTTSSSKTRVFVTNYVNLWYGEFDNNELIELMLDSNRGLEAPDENFLKVCLQMLNHPKQLDKTEFVQDTNGHLKVKFILKKEIVFKINFTLNVCSAEHFFDTVTRPLLSVIDDLRKSESELRHYLEDIRMYIRKIPEDLLMRFEKLKIEEYNDDRHMKNHNVMEELLGKTAESFDPQHILNGRPLSALLYSNLPIKEETEITGPGSSKAATTSVKSEPIDDTIKKPECTVKDEPNTAPIKSEPTDVIVKPSALKRGRSIESNGTTSHASSHSRTEPSDRLNEASDLTTIPNDNMSQLNDISRLNDTMQVPNQTSPVPNTGLPVGLLRARNSPNEKRKKLNY